MVTINLFLTCNFMSYNFSIFFHQIFCFVTIVGISLVSSDPVDAEILNAFSKLDSSQMNQAEAEKIEKSFGSLFALFGKGGGETKNETRRKEQRQKKTTTTTTTTTTRTPTKEEEKKNNAYIEEKENNTYKVIVGVLAAIKIILLKINPSEDQPLLFLVKLLETGLTEHGQHIF